MEADQQEWRARYDAYMGSARWRNARKDRIKMAGNRCEGCGIEGNRAYPLEVHHLSYDRLGGELPSDLKVVCRSCHTNEDKERAKAGEVRSRVARERARYEAAVDTFASKKYGDDWEDWVISWDGASEEFDDWVEARERW